MNRIILLLLCGILVAGSAGAQGPAQVWDLKSAAQYALENSPEFKGAGYTRESTLNETRNAFFRLLPQVDLHSEHGWEESSSVGAGTLSGVTVPTGVPTVPTNNRVSLFSISTNYTLYDNGKTWTEYKTSLITRELGEEQFNRARENLLYSLVKAFQSYSLDRKSLEVREEQFRLIERQYRSLEQQRRQGLRMRRDVLRFRLQYERAQMELVSGRMQVEQSAREILRIMGMKADVAEASRLIKPLDLESAPRQLPTVEPGAERLPDVRIARLQADEQAGSVSTAKRRLWPEISLNTGMNYSAQGYWGAQTLDQNGNVVNVPYSDLDRWGWKATVSLDFNILDWGIRRREKNVAAAREAAARATAVAKLRESEATLQNLAQELERLSKLYDQNSELRKLEQQNFEYVSAEYRDGRVTYLELIDALNSLLSSRLSYYSNVRDLLSKVTEYQYQEGKLHEVINAL